METLTTFTCFGKLPIELRLMIWDEVETPYDDDDGEARIHSIRGFPLEEVREQYPKTMVSEQSVNFMKAHDSLARLTYIDLEYSGSNALFMSSTATPIHPLLQACPESREYMIRKYGLVYAFHTYVRPAEDIFFLDYSRLLYDEDMGLESAWAFIQDKDFASRVTKIAFSSKSQDQSRRQIVSLVKAHLPNLEEVHFMYSIGEWKHHPQEYIDPRCRGRTVDCMTMEYGDPSLPPAFMFEPEDEWTNTAPFNVDQPIPRFYHHVLLPNNKKGSDDEILMNTDVFDVMWLNNPTWGSAIRSFKRDVLSGRYFARHYALVAAETGDQE